MTEPKVILLFSGKRKSGKDYICERLQKRIGDDKCTILRISGPLKQLYADNHNLKWDELMSDGPYKEKHRLDMIKWSDSVRAKDPGYFCRAACKAAPVKDVWIVSDIRRKTDIQWFKENYTNLKNIRISADLEVRKKRGWVFTPGVDDMQSECDLDNIKIWDMELVNNNDPQSLIEEILANLF